MADITIVDGSVLPPDPLAGMRRGVNASGAMTNGQLVTTPVKADDGTYSAALAGATSTIYGMTLNSAADGQPILIDRGTESNSIVLGTSTVADGQIYVASPNHNGGICPYEDLKDGDKIRLVGRGSGTDTLVFFIENTGNTMPVREGLFLPSLL